MTNTQRHHAASATIWFADGTLEPAGNGFRQLFIITCFIEAKDGEVTQIWVTFASMKRKQWEDYVALPIDGWLRSWCVVSSSRSVPVIIHYGCSFHSIQCLLRMLVKLGLFTQYLQKGSKVHTSVKLILSLYHLPPEKIQQNNQHNKKTTNLTIPTVYQHLKSLVPRHIDKFYTYIEKNRLLTVSLVSGGLDQFI